MNENGFGEVDRTYMRDIGETVDQLVDQVNDLTDRQDQFGSKLAKVQKKQSEEPTFTLPSLNNS